MVQVSFGGPFGRPECRPSKEDFAGLKKRPKSPLGHRLRRDPDLPPELARCLEEIIPDRDPQEVMRQMREALNEQWRMMRRLFN